MNRDDISAWLNAAANNTVRANQLFAAGHPVTASAFVKAAIEGLQRAYADLVKIPDEQEAR